MKVSSMAANQFIIKDVPAFKTFEGIEIKAGTIFKSYNSIICIRTVNGQIYLDSKYWDYSKTTGKYRNLFLNETKKETQKKIDSGVYILVNLNE